MQNIVFFKYYVNLYIKTFFFITTYRIIYFNTLYYKKNVHIKINAILNKTKQLKRGKIFIAGLRPFISF